MKIALAQITGGVESPPQTIIVRLQRGGDSIAAALITIAGVIQLAAFGVFPDGFRFVGDGALLLCIIYLALQKRLKPVAKICTILTIAIAAFSILQTVLTFEQWGEADKVIRQARRWIIAPTYFYLFGTTFPSIFSRRTGKMILIGLVAAVSAVVELVRSGTSLPGASLAVMGIGSNTVYKVFIPGTLYLFLAALILATAALASRLKVQTRLGCALLSLVLTAYSVTAIPFRGWVLALLMSAAGIFALFTFTTSPKRTILSMLLIAVSVSSIPFIAPNLTRQVILYYETAFGDMATGGGTIEYRRIKDVSRLDYFWDSGTALEKAIGAGFIHRESVAASVIGYSSETNDSGWVEVILTGGVIGTALLILAYIAIGLRFLQQFRPKRDWEPLACLAVWCFGGLLMYTSNPMLWDFGFVPISTCILLLQARIQDNPQITATALSKLIAPQTQTSPGTLRGSSPYAPESA